MPRDDEFIDGLNYTHKRWPENMDADRHRIHAGFPQRDETDPRGHRGEENVGYIQWLYTEHRNHKQTAVVEDIWVDPHYQRHGLATELWNRAKEIHPNLTHAKYKNQLPDGRKWAPTTAQVQRYCAKCKKQFDESEAGSYTGFCGNCREKEGLVDHAWDSQKLQEGHYGASGNTMDGYTRVEARPHPTSGLYRLWGGTTYQPGPTEAKCRCENPQEMVDPGERALPVRSETDPRGPYPNDGWKRRPTFRDVPKNTTPVPHYPGTCGWRAGDTSAKSGWKRAKSGIIAKVRSSGRRVTVPADPQSTLEARYRHRFSHQEVLAVEWPGCDRKGCEGLAQTRSKTMGDAKYRCKEHGNIKSFRPATSIPKMMGDLATYYGVPILKDLEDPTSEIEYRRHYGRARHYRTLEETRPGDVDNEQGHTTFTSFHVRPSPQGYRLYGRGHGSQTGKLGPGVTKAKCTPVLSTTHDYDVQKRHHHDPRGPLPSYKEIVNNHDEDAPGEGCKCGWTAFEGSMGPHSPDGFRVRVAFSGRSAEGVPGTRWVRDPTHVTPPYSVPYVGPRRWENVEVKGVQWPTCGRANCDNLSTTKHANQGSAHYRCDDHNRHLESQHLYPVDKIIHDISDHYQVPILRDATNPDSVLHDSELPTSPKITQQMKNDPRYDPRQKPRIIGSNAPLSKLDELRKQAGLPPEFARTAPKDSHKFVVWDHLHDMHHIDEPRRWDDDEWYTELHDSAHRQNEVDHTHPPDPRFPANTTPPVLSGDS